MKAMLLIRRGTIEKTPLELKDVPIPEPGRGEVRIAVRACGICHTDLHVCEGELSGGVLPVVPGHQVIGVVDKIGSPASGRREEQGTDSSRRAKGESLLLRRKTAVRSTACARRNAIPAREAAAAPRERNIVLPGMSENVSSGQNGIPLYRGKVGDRVGVAWLHRACGKCRFCLRGNENLCEDAQFTGHSVNGGFAEYIIAPEDFVYPIPATFSDIKAAPLLCAGIIGYRAMRLSGIKPGGRLALYGFGASAHICIQIARHWGCEVFVFTRSAAHQALARRLGAAWVGAAVSEANGLHTPPRKYRRTTAPPRADSAIIFAPAGELVPVALRNLEKGGTLALAGIHMSPIPQLDYDNLLYHEKTIRSVANSTRQDGHEFLKLASEIPIRTETTVFRLEEANRALQLLKMGQINGAGVLQVR